VMPRSVSNRTNPREYWWPKIQRSNIRDQKACQLLNFDL
jgi:hypothetical protein